MFEYDDLSIFRGRDIQITDKIIITQPTLGEIEEFGESKYFNAVRSLTGVGADFKWQLYDIGIDYTEISDYDLFVKYIYNIVSSKKKLINKMTIEERNKITEETILELYKNPLELILKDSDSDKIDLADFILCKNNNINEIVLYNPTKDITIDRLVYNRIVDIVRKMHKLKRNNQLPANETTKMDLIEDARDEYLASVNKEPKSILLPLVSALICKTGYNHNDIWDLKINAFFDSIKRIDKIQDAQLLLQGAYSGFADLKGIDRERLNWSGDLT